MIVSVSFRHFVTFPFARFPEGSLISAVQRMSKVVDAKFVLTMAPGKAHDQESGLHCASHSKCNPAYRKRRKNRSVYIGLMPLVRNTHSSNWYRVWDGPCQPMIVAMNVSGNAPQCDAQHHCDCSRTLHTHHGNTQRADQFRMVRPRNLGHVLDSSKDRGRNTKECRPYQNKRRTWKVGWWVGSSKEEESHKKQKEAVYARV